MQELYCYRVCVMLFINHDLQVEKELKDKLIKELTEDQFYNSTTGKYEPFGVTFNIAQNKVSCIYCTLVNKPLVKSF